MWALILNNHVIDTTADDPAGRYHPSISIEQIDNQMITAGWHYADGTFTPPDLALFLADNRRDALKSIAEKHAEMLVAATGGATAAERDTWIVKERDAKSVMFDGATASDALIPVDGETLLDLASKVMMKATLFRQLVGIADHIKRTSEKAVEALPLSTLDDLAALDALLETAKQQALAALQQATTT